MYTAHQKPLSPSYRIKSLDSLSTKDFLIAGLLKRSPCAQQDIIPKLFLDKITYKSWKTPLLVACLTLLIVDQVVWRWDLSSKCSCWYGSRKIGRWKLICICVFVLMYFIRVFVQWEAGVDFEMGAVRVGDGSSFGNCKFAPVPVTSSPSYWTCGKFGANQMQIQNLTETRDISQKKSNSGSPLPPGPGLNSFSRQRRILELILILSQL